MRNQQQIDEVKAATIRRFSELWKRNFLANQGIIQRGSGVMSLVRKFKNIPALVVGAGPSLDKNIHLLREVRDKAVILSSDAALKPLLHHGVTPTFVVCLDPQEEIAKFLAGVPHRGMALVAPTIVHPRVLETWEGSVVFYHQHAPDIPILTEIQKNLPRVGALTPGGSVLSVTYHFAFEIGCNPIIFIGQDLSYPNPRTYSRAGENDGEDLASTLRRQRDNVVQERDMFGASLPTLKSMAVAKQWFHWAFTTWKRDLPVNVINASEAGILTGHCALMPLREAVYKHVRTKVNVPWMLKKAMK